MLEKDTIAAIATGLTDSGIGIIRISGPEAVETGNKVFQSPKGLKILETAQSHVMQYGFAVDNENNFIIDEVMAVVMRGPRSFTGEDTVEIQCHGGVFVMKKLLSTVLKCGARLAQPGEFTKRAFLNGRIDLSRAEAVMDVIQSQNESALASSVNQLQGKLSEKIRALRSDILYEIAFIESALDDPEHISLDGYPKKLQDKAEYLIREIQKLICTADNGKLIKEGINTVIVGKPNAGKSSLLNCLVGEERAIVTEIAGTTRDVLTESVRLGEINLNIVDTAGIRNTEDTVEKIGVEKARKYASNADLILYVADGSVKLDENDREIISFIKNKKVIVLLNKSDLDSEVTEEEIRKLFKEKNSNMENRNNEDNDMKDSNIGDNDIEDNDIEDNDIEDNDIEDSNKKVFKKEKEICIIRTSAKGGEGMDIFEKRVKDMFFHEELKSSNEVIITNLRHKEALQKAFDSLNLVKKSIEEGMPEDFYSIDLMDSYASLGSITGEDVGDDLVNEIFSKFCMGK